MYYHFKILTCIILMCFFYVKAQTVQQETDKITSAPQSPLIYCCDNIQAEGQYAEASSSILRRESNCQNVTITVRQCVDRTREEYLCTGSTGARYCRENPDFNYPYPRYYALYHPMVVSPLSLTFTKQYGSGNPNPQTFSISNGVWQAFQIDNTLNWSATKTQSWLTVSPANGSVSGTTLVTVTASINVAGLSPGTYTDVITVSASQVSNRQYERISVTLNITSSFSVSISGPSYLACAQLGTWTASVTGGTSPYHYQWYYYVICDALLQSNSIGITPLAPPCGTWLAGGTDSPTYNRSGCVDFQVKCVAYDALNTYATSNITYVSVGGGFAKNSTESAIENIALAEEIGKKYLLSQNYPNPFNPSTEIRFCFKNPQVSV